MSNSVKTETNLPMWIPITLRKFRIDDEGEFDENGEWESTVLCVFGITVFMFGITPVK